ncbi:hypothetical protein SFOMI_1068 [Sphingobium fuliginis]|uniref:Uncharacterized protein n=1 Tax=Sphingobium fuliginis (strain ATCC 27551) TaxID=336203 RepID=A0A292ZCI2_SPHSA|nr:hypothetical protein SFOMI_1068 [Sphingobium fuliginis]
MDKSRHSLRVKSGAFRPPRFRESSPQPANRRKFPPTACG